MSKETDIQKKYLEIQTKEHQIQKAQEQLINISHHIQELIKIEATIDEIKKTKEGTEILVPLGTGIFAKANLKDNKELVLGVGSKVHVSKDVDETKKIISNQIRNMEDLALEVEHSLHDISGQVQDIQQDLIKIMNENKE